MLGFSSQSSELSTGASHRDLSAAAWRLRCASASDSESGVLHSAQALLKEVQGYIEALDPATLLFMSASESDDSDRGR